MYVGAAADERRAACLHRAQEQAPAPRTESADRRAGSGADRAGKLLHESREAAGEEKDEMAEFKQSASVRMISRLTGLNLQQSYWLSVILNFV